MNLKIKDQIKIVLTGGGTAGHVMPHIALLPFYKSSEIQVYYVGSKMGIEKKIIPEEIPFFSIQTGKLRRYIDFKNLTDLFRILIGFFQCIGFLLKIKPQLIFSKGGFVSVPVVWAGALLRIPIILHESDLSPGLANKLSLPFASRVFISFADTNKFIKKGGAKIVHVGIPIRDSILQGRKEIAYTQLNLHDKSPILLVMGGSLGAQSLNHLFDVNIEELSKKYQIIHIRGKNQLNPSLSNLSHYHQFEYVSEELPHFYSAAHLFVGRAGANTLFELLALKLPSLLVPLSKAASRGDQLENAKIFEQNQWSKVWWPEESRFPENFPLRIKETLEAQNFLQKSLNQQSTPQAVSLISRELSEVLHLK